MVYFFANLPAYRQLKKLEKEILSEAEEALHDLQENTRLDPVFEEDGNWVFAISPAGSKGELRRALKRLADGVMAFREKMCEYERRLQGFNCLIDSGEGGVDRARLDLFKKEMLFTSGEGELLITKRALQLFDGILTTTPAAEGLFVVSGVKSEDEPLEPAADFFVRDRFIPDFKAALESIYLDESDATVVIVLSKPGDGGLETVRFVLGSIYASTEASCIAIRGGYTRFGDSVPVEQSISEALDFYLITDYLSDNENSLWERHLRLLEKGGGRLASDRADIDFFQILDLQLTAYERYMDGELSPPTWLCESFTALCPAVKRAVLRIIGSKSRIIPIIVCDEAPDDLQSVPHTLLQVPDIQASEIVAGAETDGLSGESAVRYMQKSDGSLKTLCRILRLSMDKKPTERELKDPLCALLSELDPAIQRALLLLLEGHLVLHGERLARFLEKDGLPNEMVSAARLTYQELKLDSVIDPGELSRAVECLDQLPGISRMKSLQAVCSFITDEYHDIASGSHPQFHEKFHPGPSVIEFLKRAKAPETGYILLKAYVEDLLETGDLKTAGEALNNLEQLRKKPDTAAGLSALKLKASVFSRDEQKAAAALAELRSFNDLNSSDMSGQRCLEYARYYYATGAYQEALQESKNALLYFQQRNVSRENEAYLYIGLNMLALSRIDEAAAYLQIARESAQRDNAMLFILNGIYASITHFIIGNQTRARAALEETGSVAKGCALHRFELYLVFLEVRIQFELGRYERCIELCAHGLTLCMLYGDEPRPVFQSWLKRAEAFSGSAAKAATALEHFLEALAEKSPVQAEARLFLAEALFLSDQQEKAFRALRPELFGFRNEPDGFEPAEKMRWSSGFAQLEDRALGGELLGLRIRAFRAYLQSLVENTETGMNELTRITREEKLSHIDPYNGLYFYFYACAIGNSFGVRNLDRLTALSKAFKYIQERAATMDNSADKQSYLRRNYFNARILEDARASNLM